MRLFFFFNDTATTEIYTLSLHDALPICAAEPETEGDAAVLEALRQIPVQPLARSEEHTSELQSRLHLVCRLLLEKKKKQTYHVHSNVIHSIAVQSPEYRVCYVGLVACAV